MSKYIIELDENVKEVVVISLEDGDMWTETMEVEDLEQLNSDYINEHFSDLQDTAYQKGLEDGKVVNDKGCEGCRYGGTPQGDFPCFNCSNYYQNNWTAKQTDDEIKVGDEVEVLNSGSKYLVAWIAGTSLCGFAHDGVTCRLQPSDVRKTGRHFDICTGFVGIAPCCLDCPERTACPDRCPKTNTTYCVGVLTNDCKGIPQTNNED